MTPSQLLVKLTPLVKEWEERVGTSALLKNLYAEELLEAEICSICEQYIEEVADGLH